ncbi:hypothetical protein MPTK1_5g11840 [Marchantia polymorpha subsp. ruderalis]|uniref:Uncharacterized protein n=2 Tax=Marchantia polymorpha TaxID=3197 RepID=A0AAF6BHE8_MARPO|nr:hypothetical protein MARPO_0143s0012 [Marchantia polymorpha]BBN11432.1 hypothetical protein Mp_5g11840 [Marchantia polymorpha subsp. ruderalis]|eukprot:PTQ29330.1 hypothetical protein MARPO_0143s0012 [Marchantia polymorpha]
MGRPQRRKSKSHGNLHEKEGGRRRDPEKAERGKCVKLAHADLALRALDVESAGHSWGSFTPAEHLHSTYRTDVAGEKNMSKEHFCVFLRPLSTTGSTNSGWFELGNLRGGRFVLRGMAGAL